MDKKASPQDKKRREADESVEGHRMRRVAPEAADIDDDSVEGHVNFRPLDNQGGDELLR